MAPARPSLLFHPDFEQMSHGGEGSRETIRVVDTIQEALADCHHVVAFTARARAKQRRLNWREHGPTLQDLADDPEQRLALVFGSEESGLTKEEAACAAELAHLRTSVEHTSLNLAQAVTVVLHSLFSGNTVHQTEQKTKQIDQREREFLKEKMQTVFAQGVARTDSAAEDISSMINRMFTRAMIEPRDARAWHLILRAMGSEAEPSEFGVGGQAKGARRAQALERRRRLDAEQGGAASKESRQHGKGMPEN